MLAAITLWGMVVNLLILAAVLIAAMAAMLYAAIHRLSHAKVLPGSAEDAARQDALLNRTKRWAEANTFIFLGHYQMGQTQIMAWQLAGKAALLCQYLTRTGETFEFITPFAEDIWLTTSNARDGQLLPRPAGKFNQTYPDQGLDALWQRHMDMATYLIQQGGAQTTQIELPLEETMNQAMLQQVGYVQSMRLWPVRAVWWYFAGQRQKAGLSILDQRQLGWIVLPNEMAEAMPAAAKG